MVSRELLERAKQNEENAIEQIMEQFMPLFRRLTRSFHILGSSDDDLIQEGMLGLYLAIGSYQFGESASFESFAFNCIYKRIYKAIKQANAKKHQPLNYFVSIDEVGYSINSKNEPLDIILRREKSQMFWGIVDSKLSRVERDTVLLFMEGYSYHEIANRLNKDTKSVDNALSRAKKKIAKAFEDAEKEV